MHPIGALLDKWIPHPVCPLPYEDPFMLLVAVLLSARCTDRRVNQIAPLLFRKASTPEQMADLDPKDIEDLIRPCGLAPTKSRAVVNLARDLIAHHRGKVPCSLKSLETLPGVGHKTASVVLVQAFHRPAFPVDAHIHRCANRWGLSSGKSIRQTEKDLKRIFPKKEWGRRHLQILLFGRIYCTARGHRIDKCPICELAIHFPHREKIPSRSLHKLKPETNQDP